MSSEECIESYCQINAFHCWRLKHKWRKACIFVISVISLLHLPTFVWVCIHGLFCNKSYFCSLLQYLDIIGLRTFHFIVSLLFTLFMVWYLEDFCWHWRGIRGRVVRVIDFEPLAFLRSGFEYRQGLWILSCEEAIRLTYGTSVVLLRCPLMPEIMHGWAPEVFLHQWKLEVSIIIYDLNSVGVTLSLTEDINFGL